MKTYKFWLQCRFFIVALLISLLTLSSCTMSRSLVTGNKRAYGYTWEQEKQIGQEADASIIEQYGMYDDRELSAYVEQVGERVLAESHLNRPDTPEEFRNTDFTFRVLDSPVVNAFALPGGFIYVTRGLLAHMDNEAQLAVVLGHEVGHVIARHSSQRALSGTFAQLGVFAGAIGGAVAGVNPESILQLGGAAAQLLLLKYGREDELESDALGVEYAAMTNYQASEGSKFFTTLKRIGEQSGQSLPNFLSTHPDPGQREERIVRLAQEYEGEYEMNIINQDALYSVIDGIVYGENPRQGFVQDNVFYHPDLRFLFPTPNGWTVVNQPRQVIMVDNPQQYSAVMTFGAAEGSSAQAAASNLVNQEGITVRQQGATTVNGLPAYAVDLVAQPDQNTQIRALAYFIEYGGAVWQILGYSNAQNFGNFERTFLNTMRGFQQLRDRQILNIQPVRLNITRAPRTGEFQQLVPNNLPRNVNEEELAIINQVNLNTQIQQGQALKLVEQ